MSGGNFRSIRSTVDSITVKLQQIKAEVERLEKQRDSLTGLDWSALEMIRYQLNGIGE